MLKLALAAVAATVVGISTPAMAQYFNGPGVPPGGIDEGLGCIDYRACEVTDHYLNYGGGFGGFGGGDTYVYTPIIVDDSADAVDVGDPRFVNQWGGPGFAAPPTVIIVRDPVVVPGVGASVEDDIIGQELLSDGVDNETNFVNMGAGYDSGPMVTDAAVIVDADQAARCEARYQSYDAETNMFLGYDGQLHECRL